MGAVRPVRHRLLVCTAPSLYAPVGYFSEVTMPQVGSSAPDFSVSDETGKIRTLEEFKGNTVVLWFYPRADTPG